MSEITLPTITQREVGLAGVEARGWQALERFAWATPEEPMEALSPEAFFEREATGGSSE